MAAWGRDNSRVQDDPSTALDRAAERIETPCGDGTLVWRCWGPPRARPVLLLHGGSGSWTHWVRNIGPLATAEWRVVVPDLPGFGDSAAPPDGEDADVLPGWLEQGWRQLAGPSADEAVAGVGFSFGGLVAGLWARQQPRRFGQLVLVGVPALSDERLAPLDLRPWHQVPEGPARDAVHRHNLLQLMLADEASADAGAVRMHARNVERDRLRKRRLMLTDALARLLPTLSCRVAGLWGREDALYRMRPALVERVLATAARPGPVHWIDGAGHWVGYEAADEFNQRLAQLLGPPG